MPEILCHHREFDHTCMGNHKYFADEEVTKTIVFHSAAGRPVNIGRLDDHSQFEAAIATEYGKTPRIVSDVGFYFLKNCSIRGRGFPMLGNKRFYAPDLIPSWVESEINNALRTEFDPSVERRLRYFSGTTISLFSESYPVFGHWLVDMIPKIWLFSSCFGESLNDVKFLIPSDIPDFGLEILSEVFGLDNSKFLFFDIENEIPVLERAILPSLMHNDYVFHPSASRAFSFVLEKCRIKYGEFSIKSPDKIFVSRHKFRSQSISSIRQMQNEDEILSIARNEGFAIVSPEDFSFPDKVNLFSRAQVIAGEYGSGLHLSVFSPPGSRTLCIRPATDVQSNLAAVRGQTVFFLSERKSYPHSSASLYDVDPVRFRFALQACIGSKV
ncbi:glycosyltransferase family 61 protein [Methylobacterium fujisawaense]